MMHRQTSPDVLAAFGAIAPLIVDNLQSGFSPSATAIRFWSAYPIAGLLAGLVSCSELASTVRRTESPLRAALIELPRLSLKRMTAVFAGQRDRWDPSWITLASNSITGKGIRGPNPFTKLVASEARAAHHSVLHMPFAAARLATKPSGSGAIRLHRKQLAANLASQLNHARIIPPFTGSGSTGVAALQEGFRFVGVEREPEYVEIAQRRIGATA